MHSQPAINAYNPWEDDQDPSTHIILLLSCFLNICIDMMKYWFLSYHMK